MQTIQIVLRYLVRPAVLLAVGLTLLAATTQAATIKIESKIPGYTARGSGWTLVLPELRSLLGGRIVWDPVRNCYVTDHVSVGEPIRVTITPTATTERCLALQLVGLTPGLGVQPTGPVPLPFVWVGYVSPSPATTQVYVWVRTTLGFFEKRVQVGAR